MAEDIAVYATPECCWRCAGALVELRPPLDGWRYYCRACEHLTLAETECDAALRALPAGAAGTVVAVRRPLRIEVSR